MTGGHIPRASGMKLVLQRSVATSSGSPIAVAIGGVQPHDSVERLQLGARTGSMPIPTGGEGPVACQDSWYCPG